MIDFVSNYWQEALYALLSASVCFSARKVTQALNRVEAISRGTRTAPTDILSELPTFTWGD